MNQAEIVHIKKDIQAIKDVLNYHVDVKEALEKGLLAPPVINLERDFRMYKEMSQEGLERKLEQLQEEKNLLLRGNFCWFYVISTLIPFLFIISSSCSSTFNW